MTERGILFNGTMVRALLDGSKTQTRRVVKPQPYEGGRPEHWSISELSQFCPYGQPGDRLWVRETFAYLGTNKRGPHAYCADTDDGERIRVDAPWKPSIHMPRAASRILLEIVSVRVERLNEISEGDAQAEGWQYRPDVSDDPDVHTDAARDWYSDLWEQINGAGSWDTNPWVWVIEFKRVTP